MSATGGVQRYTSTLCRAFEEILGSSNVRTLAVSAEPRPLADGGFALSPLTKFRFLLAALTQALRWRPQLVVCTQIGVAPAGRVIQRLFGPPYWVVLHGVEVWGDLSQSKARALRAARRLISTSHFTYEAASARHDLSGMDVAFLPPCFAPTAANDASATQPSTASSHDPIVLTVGRLSAAERYKGHDVLLDAWPSVLQRVPEAIYCIVGDGDDRPRLETRVREMRLTNSVRFTGAVTGEQLEDWYHRCRVFAMPARTDLNRENPRGEGFGIAFLEAMSHGKPVIGPRVGAPSEFIHPREHGLLVDPSDPADVAKAAVELLLDNEQAERMGRAARDWVAREFSEERFRRRLAMILEKAAA